MMKKKNFVIFIIFLLIIVSIYFIILERTNPFKYVNSDLMYFNYSSGFYNESIEIKISKNIELPLGTDLYYTLDGNDPTIDSNKYEDGILLEIGDDINVYPLKVIAYVNNKYSDVYVMNYLLYKDIENLDIDVVSIETNSENLYDYETGIFVPGYYYDYNKENGATGYIKGNFNQRGVEWIRPSYVTMFDNKGNILLNQKIGLSISGNSSAALSIKSMKLVSNYGFSDKKINIDLYDDLYSTNNSMVMSYNSIRLSSGGQDGFNGNIRSSIISRLANESSFDGCSTTKRTLVFLNGKICGIYNIQQPYSDSFIGNKYNLPDNNKIVTYKGSEYYSLNSLGLFDLFKKDLNIKDNRDELEKYFDMDNYLKYYAINILANNVDWPYNNYEIWKYDGEFDENNKYTDGKFRFLIYDTDLIYYGDSGQAFFEQVTGDILDYLTDPNETLYKSSFIYVIKSNYYRNKFINILSHLYNTTFSYDNIISIVDEEVSKIKNSMDIYEDLPYTFNNKNYYANFDEKINKLKRQVSLRDKNIINILKTKFNLSDMYELNINPNSTAIILVDDNMVNSGVVYKGNYFYGTNLELNFSPIVGYEFKYWVVNGEKVYDKKLIIIDDMINNGIVDVSIILQQEDSDLIISEISTKKYDSWIKIYNPTNRQIYLDDYCLTDNLKKGCKSSFSNISLNSNEYLIINFKGNLNSLNDYVVGFKVKDFSNIYLLKNSNVIDSIYTYELNDFETYGRYMNSDIYNFYNNNFYNRKEGIT